MLSLYPHDFPISETDNIAIEFSSIIARYFWSGEYIKSRWVIDVKASFNGILCGPSWIFVLLHSLLIHQLSISIDKDGVLEPVPSESVYSWFLAKQFFLSEWDAGAWVTRWGWICSLREMVLPVSSKQSPYISVEIQLRRNIGNAQLFPFNLVGNI